jgi:hypothetical protein
MVDSFGLRLESAKCSCFHARSEGYLWLNCCGAWEEICRRECMVVQPVLKFIALVRNRWWRRGRDEMRCELLQATDGGHAAESPCVQFVMLMKYIVKWFLGTRPVWSMLQVYRVSYIRQTIIGSAEVDNCTTAAQRPVPLRSITTLMDWRTSLKMALEPISKSVST